MNLRYAFQDDEKCFFGLDLMLGGDLRCTFHLTFLHVSYLPDVMRRFLCVVIVHLERLGSLTEETVRFYVAEISSALSFLHEKKIIHRCVRTLSASFGST